MTTGPKLVEYHTTPPCLVNWWCMLGGSVEIFTKNILYPFMKGQYHFGMSRGATMSFALNEVK